MLELLFSPLRQLVDALIKKRAIAIQDTSCLEELVASFDLLKQATPLEISYGLARRGTVSDSLLYSYGVTTEAIQTLSFTQLPLTFSCSGGLGPSNKVATTATSRYTVFYDEGSNVSHVFHAAADVSAGRLVGEWVGG